MAPEPEVSSSSPECNESVTNATSWALECPRPPEGGGGGGRQAITGGGDAAAAAMGNGAGEIGRGASAPPVPPPAPSPSPPAHPHTLSGHSVPHRHQWPQPQPLPFLLPLPLPIRPTLPMVFGVRAADTRGCPAHRPLLCPRGLSRTPVRASGLTAAHQPRVPVCVRGCPARGPRRPPGAHAPATAPPCTPHGIARGTGTSVALLRRRGSGLGEGGGGIVLQFVGHAVGHQGLDVRALPLGAVGLLREG